MSNKEKKLYISLLTQGTELEQKISFVMKKAHQDRSLYGKTKCDAEKVVRKHKNSICFRLATVFGESYRMRTDLLVNNFVYNAL